MCVCVRVLKFSINIMNFSRLPELIFELGVSRCPLLLCRIFQFNICRNLMSSFDTVFSLGFVSRKSISRALTIEVGMFFKEI